MLITYHDVLGQHAAQRVLQGDLDGSGRVGMLKDEGQGVIDCAGEGGREAREERKKKGQ